ncbi:hypothetical protein BKA57DRAFT_531925 [Linnemannia elongata]|nr:hypothetical protein BKA57DRAFT_531925 [Linnemannia elongata]
MPFKFQRLQFPVQPAFAMTINKSQGQTLDTVGFYLKKPVPIPSTTARTIAAPSQEPPHERPSSQEPPHVRPPSQEPSQEQSPSQNPRQFTTTFTVMKACLFTLSALALAVQGSKVEIDKRSQTYEMTCSITRASSPIKPLLTWELK